MKQFYVVLFFDDRMEAVEHQLMCMNADEAIAHFDSVFLTLHMPGAHPNHDLSAWERPSALGLRRIDSEEFLAYYPFVPENQDQQ